MHEPVILSPLEFPFAWVAFVLNWGGAAACVLFAFRLWQATSARWWLLIGAAFLLSILSFIARCVICGSLPLPHGMASPEVPLPPSTAYTFGTSRMVQVEYDWNIAAPIIGVALWWAYRTIRPTTEPGASNGGPAKHLGNTGADALGGAMTHPAEPRRRVSSLWLLPLAALGLACLVALLLPPLVGGGPSKTMRIVSNLRQIELMKRCWALDYGVTGAVEITEHDLAPYAYGYSSNGVARSVAGERYIIHPLGVGPEAVLTQPYGKLPAGAVIRLQPKSNQLFRIILPNHLSSPRGQ